ncbi:MAG: hypothetical protein L6Q54_06640 [Leptospiraceae bacterium]|nr:hypothetical protein [Leptospiraceae bacterium]NUM40030.1 hypothetical protein [Leptospiraceae bacterium]
MNFFIKSISFLFILNFVISLLVLNIQWGRKTFVLKNSEKTKQALRTESKSVFVRLFELKNSVFIELNKDFEKRKKVRLNYE